MDASRFDSLTRSLATRRTRRGVLGGIGALAAGLLGSRSSTAQVTQAQCGNVICGANPCVCKPGCVCCVWSNGNSRCMPPGTCTGTVTSPTTTTTAAPTTAAPTTTTTTSTTTLPPLNTNPDPTCAGANGCAGDQGCGSGCVCGSTIEGGGVCFTPSACPETACASSAECAEGSFCVVVGTACCTVFGTPTICLPRCGTAAFATEGLL